MEDLFLEISTHELTSSGKQLLGFLVSYEPETEDYHSTCVNDGLVAGDLELRGQIRNGVLEYFLCYSDINAVDLNKAQRLFQSLQSLQDKVDLFIINNYAPKTLGEVAVMVAKIMNCKGVVFRSESGVEAWGLLEAGKNVDFFVEDDKEVYSQVN